MTSDQPRRVEIEDDGETVAAAEVTLLEGSEGTVRTSLLPSSRPYTAGQPGQPVDAVMDLPEVQARSRLEATIPLGDAESLERLRERTDETVTRAAGSTGPATSRIAPSTPTECSVRSGVASSARLVESSPATSQRCLRVRCAGAG